MDLKFKILVTLTFKEPGGKDFGMTTNVLEFDRYQQAEIAFEQIDECYPNGGVHVVAVKLYQPL